MEVLAEFHVRYESIHPFQDGNVRTGRIILFRECLQNRISPVMIEDAKRSVYFEGLRAYREKADISILEKLFADEQEEYCQRAGYFM
ncbi:MAG: Fic family protein [Lachnospiraceae bacterium]|nr:Fic family protein [Lachnospiraceae bacterium]